MIYSHLFMKHNVHISSRFSSNSETNVSELLENPEEMFSQYHRWRHHCISSTTMKRPSRYGLCNALLRVQRERERERERERDLVVLISLDSYFRTTLCSSSFLWSCTTSGFTPRLQTIQYLSLKFKNIKKCLYQEETFMW